MRCPVDNETLVMADRSGVEIDYCPKCRGVWLDRGELDKILERTSGPAPAAPAAPLASRGGPVFQPEPERPRSRDDDRTRAYPTHRDDDDEDRHRDGYRKKKRESFLSDLFDF